MQQLNEAIAAVLREVEQGCAKVRAGHTLLLNPARVCITLNFALGAGRPPQVQPDGPHSVTVEFVAGEAGRWQPVAEPAAAGKPAVSAAEGDGVVLALSQVFGAPGFDSSARATVFRETLEDMSDEHAQAVVAALASPLASIPDEATRRAVHILRGLILSGPAKQTERGAAALRAALAGQPLAEVLRRVATTWKTQDDWLG